MVPLQYSGFILDDAACWLWLFVKFGCVVSFCVNSVLTYVALEYPDY
jgi:hypothetical protein